jgi:hypothetical protein
MPADTHLGASGNARALVRRMTFTLEVMAWPVRVAGTFIAYEHLDSRRFKSRGRSYRCTTFSLISCG